MPTGSWKTTLSGVVLILTTAANAISEYTRGGLAAVNLPVLLTGLSGGIGLMFARDNNKSSVDVGIQEEVPKAQASTVVTDSPPKKP